MQEYIIIVNDIEEWQNTSNIKALEKVFERAKSTIINGEKVILMRKDSDGKKEQFDTLTTLEDLQNYQTSVFKYL